MTALARWNLTVSRNTDVALRTLLASRGGRRGELSRFVEEAVNREVLRQTANDIRARNAGIDEDQVTRLVDEALGAIGGAFWVDARR